VQGSGGERRRVGRSNADRRSDAELLAASTRDAEAFRAFYDRCFARVTAYAARRCSSGWTKVWATTSGTPTRAVDPTS